MVAELVAEWEGEPRIVQKWWPRGRADKEPVETLFAELHRDALPFMDAWRQYVYRLALTLLLEGREHAAAARRRAVTLNYNDLLQYAATLLRDNAEVRAALQDKYRWLFVDEFQDTDPVQAEVILLLAGAPSAERDWTRVPLRPGALFVVGDPKQSIYRFRRADIDIYQRVRAADRGDRRPGHHAHRVLPLRARPVRLGQPRLRRAVPGRAHAASAGLRRPPGRARRERRPRWACALSRFPTPSRAATRWPRSTPR